MSGLLCKLPIFSSIFPVIRKLLSVAKVAHHGKMDESMGNSRSNTDLNNPFLMQFSCVSSQPLLFMHCICIDYETYTTYANNVELYELAT